MTTNKPVTDREAVRAMILANDRIEPPFDPIIDIVLDYARGVVAGQSVGDADLRDDVREFWDALADKNEEAAALFGRIDAMLAATPASDSPAMLETWRCPNCHVRFSRIDDVDAHIAALATPAPSRDEVEKLRDALVPFASMAATDDTDGVNMNDPLKKWITIGQLQAAREALNKDSGDVQ